MLRTATGLLICCLLARAEALDLSLPTDNEALLENRPDGFFMGVDREGRRVWQGGTFGFVRSPLAWPGGTVFTQFHEGIDITPVRRDASGRPADPVRAIAAGTVVLCEPQGRSQYGNQVVVRHDWDGGAVFSRYAHLQSVSVARDEALTAGQPLGVLGHTGGALTPERAHLHLEINLMLNETADLPWPARLGEDGRYHPANMKGVDAAALLTAARADPGLTLPAFIKAQTPYFTVVTPASGEVDLLRRHSWLAAGKTAAPGWTISFTEWGLPVQFTPLADPPPARPEVTWVRAFEGKHIWRTGGLLAGTGQSAALSAQGEALLRVILAR